MPTVLDDIMGMKIESVFGTRVTVDRFYPHLDAMKSLWDPRIRTGEGLHGGSGRISPLSSRTYPTAGQGVVTMKAELESEQGGVLLYAAWGTQSVVSIAGTPGGSFQLFHPGITGTYLNSWTIQHVKVRNDGTNYVETYGGCTPSKVTIEQPEDGIPTIEVVFDALNFTAATAAATASYASASTLYDAYRVTATGTGGTLTVPTTSAFGTGPTSVDFWREFSFEIDHQIDDKDWKLGTTRGRPIAGIPKITFSGKANFDDTTLPDALVAGTKLPFFCTWSTGITDEITTGVSAGMQLSIPQMVTMKDLPPVKAGERRVVDFSADIRNNGVARDAYFAYRCVGTTL
jgi:hypothetical protein